MHRKSSHTNNMHTSNSHKTHYTNNFAVINQINKHKSKYMINVHIPKLL